MRSPKALVMTGFGLNCDYETYHSLKLAGFSPELVHINQLIWKERSLQEFHLIVFIGGFAFGDDHGAGVILANKWRNYLWDSLISYISQGGLILGICNGFQVLVNMGLLPARDGIYGKREVALLYNDCGNFQDRWVYLNVNKNSPCVFTRGIEKIELPIRHGEGKFYAEETILKTLIAKGQVVLSYAKPDGEIAKGEFPYNPNGSLYDIAGICDESGRIFGLMPHPEAYNHWTNHPDWPFLKDKIKRKRTLRIPLEGKGLLLFHNALNYIKENL